MAYSEAVDRLFRDKELAIKVIGKVDAHSRSGDAGVLVRIRHEFYRTTAAPSFQSYRNGISETAETDPRAKGRKAEEFTIHRSTTSWKNPVTLSHWVVSSTGCVFYQPFAQSLDPG